MDGQNMPLTGAAGYPFTELPLGFGMALAMNEAAMSGYAGLTESEKEKVILRCKDAKSKKEMERIVESLAPGKNGFSMIERQDVF